MNVYRQAEVPLLVCAVVVGNAFHVVEMPRAPAPLDGAPADAPTGGHLGRAIVGKAHAHLAVVARGCDPDDPERKEWFYPCEPAAWSSERRTFTELVVRDASQVLPLGYLMVAPRRPAAGGAGGAGDAEHQAAAAPTGLPDALTANVPHNNGTHAHTSAADAHAPNLRPYPVPRTPAAHRDPAPLALALPPAARLASPRLARRAQTWRRS